MGMEIAPGIVMLGMMDEGLDLFESQYPLEHGVSYNSYVIADERVAVLMLALIALTLFETLFEARARYLFIFAPLYITLAVCGVQALADRRTARKRP